LVAKGYNKFLWWIKVGDEVLHTAIHDDDTIDPVLDNIEEYYYGNVIALRPPLTEMVSLDTTKQLYSPSDTMLVPPILQTPCVIIERDKSVLPILRKSFGKILTNAGLILTHASKKIYQPPEIPPPPEPPHPPPSPKEERLAKWLSDCGDKTLRLDYQLDENSLVLDVGGYEGQWASDIFSKYCCTIHIFEPVIEFGDKIERRFSRNKKIFVHKFGLSNHSKKASMLLAQDGSSLFKQGKEMVEVDLVRAEDFMRKSSIQNIDLMKINIEGEEYDLLEHLIDTGFVKHIKNIQVQFHDFVPNAEQRMRRIQQRLQQTHSLTYQYLFVWENWKLNDNVS
jgi:FkbM family methyltransferase